MQRAGRTGLGVIGGGMVVLIDDVVVYVRATVRTCVSGCRTLLCKAHVKMVT